MSLESGVPSSAILAAWEAIILDGVPKLEDLDGRSAQARAQVVALHLHIELLDVTAKVLHELAEDLHTEAAKSLDRTLVAWELLSARLPEFDRLDALLVDGLTPDEYREAAAILADELLVRRADCEGSSESSGHINPRTTEPIAEEDE